MTYNPFPFLPPKRLHYVDHGKHKCTYIIGDTPQLTEIYNRITMGIPVLVCERCGLPIKKQP